MTFFTELERTKFYIIPVSQSDPGEVRIKLDLSVYDFKVYYKIIAIKIL